MTFFNRQPKTSNNSTNSMLYMHFAPLLLENLPLIPHFAPLLGAIYQFTLLNMYKYFSNLILYSLSDLRQRAAALLCTPSLRHMWTVGEGSSPMWASTQKIKIRVH